MNLISFLVGRIIGESECLDTYDATATAADILKDKTAYASGEKLTGTYEPPAPAPSFDDSMQVFFFDWDGTPIAGYTKEEALALTELPAIPADERFDPQYDTYNWTLAEVKEYLADYPEADVNVGVNRSTADGKLHAVINLPASYQVNVTVTLQGALVIDWGDGSEPSSGSSPSSEGAIALSHQYPAAGRYEIAIDISGRTSERARVLAYLFTLGDGLTASAAKVAAGGVVEEVLLCRGLSYGNFVDGLRSLRKLSIPNDLVVPTPVYAAASFANSGLECVVFPTSDVYGAYIPYLSGCTQLRRVSLPHRTPYGYDAQVSDAFHMCRALESITFPRNATQYISNTLYGCASLKKVVFVSGSAMESDYLTSAAQLMELYYPSVLSQNKVGRTGLIGSNALTKVVVPDNVVSIGNYFLGDCHSIASVKLPDSLTSIGSNFCSSCSSLLIVDMSGVASVPTISSSPLTSHNNALKILVPEALLADFQAATNWSTLASYMVGV